MAWKKSTRKKAVQKKHKAITLARDRHVKGRRSTEHTVNAPKKIF